MPDTCLNMSNDSGLPEECREARRRRKGLRRITAISADAVPPQPSRGQSGTHKRRREGPDGDPGGGTRFRPVGSHSWTRPPLLSLVSSSSSSSSSRTASSSGMPEAPVAPSSSRRVDAVDSPPEFGSVSLAGRSREMEDAVSLHPGFFSPGADGASPLHFFAVFDGHGGTHVSELCKERMHIFLAEELQQVESEHGGGRFTVDVLSAVMTRCFRRMDELALAACACGSVGEPPCGCDQAGLSSQIVGSTAVVVVVDGDRVLVANCGDSRAVLSRGGRAVPLSSDHKPDRPDELARIEAAGGRVIFVNGARVLGILAMSRALGVPKKGCASESNEQLCIAFIACYVVMALGSEFVALQRYNLSRDKYLKPVVIAEPEISITERTPEDEFLIIASDGLWDVLSNELACDVARRCLQDGSQHANAVGLDVVEGSGGDAAIEQQEAPESYCSVAATLLTRLALGRNSRDNISVIVVDLRRCW
ncbi:hypothetical protein Taro_009861 [Colocasia esculenta]|uniref:protein-serine/threonine phosphatase n=1 Tax=Colocasia esculenta TaxID=4460 RepID=A0A843UBD2_COLES|nr:hypothetical protein [Colocasia esculenta]